MLLTASYYDVRRCKIPSWLNYLAVLSSLLYAAVSVVGHPPFALYAAVAFLLPYLLWRINLVGGADAKLLTLACLITPNRAFTFSFPFLFISLSYALSFAYPDPKLLLSNAPFLAPVVTVALLLTPRSLPYLLLVLLFFLKAAELNALGYSEKIPLDELTQGHMVREALRGGMIVEVSDLDMFFRRRRFDYIPPLLLDEEEVERIREMWRWKGRDEVMVARERPSIPAILLALILHPLIL
jgi:hypothetical protein